MANKVQLWSSLLGGVAALVPFLLTADSALQWIVGVAVAVSVASLIYVIVVAVDEGRQVLPLAIWMGATLVLAALYAFLLVSDRNKKIADLERTALPTVTVWLPSQPTGSTGAPSAAPTSTNPTSATSSPTASMPTSTPTLAEFEPSQVGVRTSGTTSLRVGEYGLQIDRRWGDSNNNGGTLTGGHSEIIFRESGMSAQEGTQFALLRAGAKRSFPTCQAEKSWVTSLGWSQLNRGTFVCLMTPGGRRGMLRIDVVPDFDDDRPWVQVTGVTWTPVVDR